MDKSSGTANPKMSDNVANKLAELKLSSDYQEEPQNGFINRSCDEKKENSETHACKQVFASLPCLPFDNNLVYCFVLSVWDNVIGPQTVQVWKRESNPLKSAVYLSSDITNEKISEIGDHGSSHSEATNAVKGKSMDTYVVSKTTSNNGPSRSKKSESNGKGSRLQSIVRYVTEHTVTLVQAHQHNQSNKCESGSSPPTIMIIPQHGIIIQALRFVVREADEMLVPHCLSMVVSIREEQQLLQLSSLTAAYLTRILRKLHLLLIHETLPNVGPALAPHLQELCWVLVSLRKHSLHHYPLLPSGQPPPDRQLALRLLTSHLQTSGYTVVVGDRSTAVNSVLLWLGLFLRSCELHLSRLCSDPCHNELQPGLFLQGIVSSKSSKEGVGADRLLQYGRPVTLCDLNSRTVSVTVLPATASLHDKEVLREVTEISKLVRQYFHDFELLASHSCEVRLGYTEAFLRSLKYQALAVISFVKHNKNEATNKLLPKLRTMFDLDSPSLNIVVAIADQLQPGFRQYLSPVAL